MTAEERKRIVVGLALGTTNLRQPGTLYHVWHVCLCERCNGKVWTHSQGDWNSHLRFVANEDVLTIPTVEESK